MLNMHEFVILYTFVTDFLVRILVISYLSICSFHESGFFKTSKMSVAASVHCILWYRATTELLSTSCAARRIRFHLVSSCASTYFEALIDEY